MNRFNVVLLVLAVVQAVLLLVLPDGRVADATEATVQGFKPNEGLTVEGVSTLAIRSDAGEEVRVRREGDEGWVLASHGDYPAREDKVASTLKALRKLYAARPLTRDPSRFADLEVAKERHHLHVTVGDRGGAVIADFYLGERGTASQLVYRRVAEDVAWGTTGLNSWDIDPGPGSWVDSSYVDLEAKDVRRVRIEREGGSLELVAREAPVEAPADPPTEPEEGEKPEEPKPPKPLDWFALVEGEEKALDASKARSFLSALTRISLAEPVGKEVLPEHGLDAPAARVTLTLADGTEHTLAIGKKREKERDWYAKASGSPFVVTLRDYVVTDITEKKLEDLFPAEKDPKPDGEDR